MQIKDLLSQMLPLLASTVSSYLEPGGGLPRFKSKLYRLMIKWARSLIALSHSFLYIK